MNMTQSVFIDRFNEIVGANATQEEIAQKIGTSRQNVGNWLSGKSKPDICMIVNIAKAYGITTDYLLGVSDDGCQYTAIKELREIKHSIDEKICKLKNLYKK